MAVILSPKSPKTSQQFTVTRTQQDPHAVILKLRHTRELHLEAKYSNDLRQGIKHHLDSCLLKYDRSLSALPLTYNSKDLREVGATRIVFDNPQLHVPVQVPWVVFKPQLGIKLEATVVSQSDLEGIRLLLELHYVNQETSANASHAVNVFVPRDRVGKVCKWEQGAFIRRKPKYAHVPDKIRVGAKMSFWVIGHTCDPDGANYALHGTLYEKDLKKLLKK